MVLDLTKIPLPKFDADDGPFTDEAVRHLIDVRNTQHGIIKYMEAMAQVMAEAAIASQKAVGDSAYFAVDRWSVIVRKRAFELIREKLEDKPS